MLLDHRGNLLTIWKEHFLISSLNEKNKKERIFLIVTGYSGATCQQKSNNESNIVGESGIKILASCNEYYKAGHRRSGLYLIKPGLSPPFKVRCKMSSDGGTTLIATTLTNETFVFGGKDYDEEFFYHRVSYQASKRQMFELMAVSNSCQQVGRTFHLLKRNARLSVILSTRSLTVWESAQ